MLAEDAETTHSGTPPLAQGLSRLISSLPFCFSPPPFLPLSQTLATCERIHRVPIPLAYSRHTSRFLIVYLILAPVYLWSVVGYGAMVFAPLTVFLLMGIDQIGVRAEQGALAKRPCQGRL